MCVTQQFQNFDFQWIPLQVEFSLRYHFQFLMLLLLTLNSITPETTNHNWCIILAIYRTSTDVKHKQNTQNLNIYLYRHKKAQEKQPYLHLLILDKSKIMHSWQSAPNPLYFMKTHLYCLPLSFFKFCPTPVM